MGLRDWFRGHKVSDLAKEHFEKGVRLGGEGKLQQAILEFSSALNSSPSFVEAHLKRANTYLLLEQYHEAISDFSEILSAKPRLVKALAGRALAYVSKAKEIFEHHLKTGGKEYQLNWEEINMPMDKLLRSIAPEKAMWIKITNTLRDLLTRAEKDAETAIKIDPTNKIAHLVLKDLSKYDWH